MPLRRRMGKWGKVVLPGGSVTRPYEDRWCVGAGFKPARTGMEPPI